MSNSFSRTGFLPHRPLSSAFTVFGFVLVTTTVVASCHSNGVASVSNDPDNNDPVLGVERAEPTQATDLQPASVSPELTDKSAQLLEQHSNKRVGTEIPFTLNGRRYIGRIEMHEGPVKGKHKGLTAYGPKDGPQRLGQNSGE